MNRSFIIRLSAIFGALIMLGLTSCSTNSVEATHNSVDGTYVSEKNNKDYGELKSDGTFLVQQEAGNFDGKYMVNGKNIILTLEDGSTISCTIVGNTITDDQGIRWTKK
jgi:hypothetical protein